VSGWRLPGNGRRPTNKDPTLRAVDLLGRTKRSPGFNVAEPPRVTNLGAVIIERFPSTNLPSLTGGDAGGRNS
jgi:hypothetical protein